MSELEIYQKQGFGNRSGMGQRPALLIVDFVNGFADPDQFGGGNIGEAIDNTRELLAEARALGLPVAFTRVVYAEDLFLINLQFAHGNLSYVGFPLGLAPLGVSPNQFDRRPKPLVQRTSGNPLDC